MTPTNKIMVGIPLEDSVKAEFQQSYLAALELMPEESASKEIIFRYIKYGNTVNSRNDIVIDFLEDSKKFTHLFFMDSDMLFPPLTLSRLLQHNKDVVGGYYTRKLMPFASTCFVENYNSCDWSTYNPKPGDGLIEVAAIGTGCLLIKREVLELRQWPWFYYKPDPNGKKRFMTEDIVFCLDARKRGYKIYCDTTIHCGHVGSVVVQPFFGDGKIKVRLDSC